MMVSDGIDANLLVLKQVTFKRGQRKVFDKLSLAIPRGKIIAIMGPSGSGKTTLLKLMAGQLKPASGDVFFDKMAVNRLSMKSLFALRRRMGMLFQSGGLFTDLNVFDNVAFALREHTRLSEAMIRDLVLMRLEAVGLRGARDLKISELSGGMSRRVALARALALDPELMMYDEPFTGQDPITMAVLVSLIKKTNQALGLTSVLVSHDVAESLSIADQVYVIAGGKLLASGSPKAIKSSKDPALQQFIQGLPDGAVPYHYAAKPYREDLLSC